MPWISLSLCASLEYSSWNSTYFTHSYLDQFWASQVTKCTLAISSYQANYKPYLDDLKPHHKLAEAWSSPVECIICRQVISNCAAQLHSLPYTYSPEVFTVCKNLVILRGAKTSYCKVGAATIKNDNSTYLP